MESRSPVLIVGGSLVGLSAAVFLAHHGVKCVLIERRPDTSAHPRAVGYYPRTVELLRSVGLEEPALKEAAGFATHRTRAGVESLAGRELFSRDEMPETDELEAVTPCRLLVLTQDRLEPLLRARAEQLGAELRFGSELTSFSQDETGVQAEIVEVASGQRHTVRSDYLVAADGPRSGVREALGIPRAGHGVMSRHISIAFQADLAGPLRGRRFSVVHIRNPVVTGIMVHDDTLRYATLIVAYDPEQGESPDDFTDQRCRTLVRAAIGVSDLPVTIRSRFPWDMAELTARAYQDGRVFIAGDAAHVIPPTGGYGANTGIADAHNLAWKLAAVLTGTADPALLRSYQAERLPVGDFAAAQGLTQFAIRSGEATPEQQAAAPDAQTVTMGYRYHSDALVGSMTITDDLAREPSRHRGEAGTRAPHLALAPGGRPRSTLDLFGSGFVVLTGPDGEEWAAAAETVAGEYGVRVDTYRLASRSPGPGSRSGLLADPDGRIRAGFGLERRGAVLVRPDGYVAWRGDAPGVDPRGVLANVLGTVLARLSPSSECDGDPSRVERSWS